jgi:carboxymethylenebutenolidase
MTAGAISRKRITIEAADGHKFGAWRSDPAGAVKGGIVVLHAVYGLTDHLGDVCDRWASEGYAAIAPALFDRSNKGAVHPYSRAGADAGIVDYAALSEDDIFTDIRACAETLRDTGGVAISGFCTGGTWAWRAAAALPFAAQVNFYGSHVPAFIDLVPACPTIMHYGDSDTIMPIDQVRRIAAAHPDVAMHIYPGASHAFYNPEQATPDPVAADLAWRRSVAFMDHNAEKTA